MKPFARVLVGSVTAITLVLMGLCGTTQDEVIVVKSSELSLKQQTAITALKRLGITSTANNQMTYSRLPLHFEMNQGQTDSQVRFLARAGNYNLFLKPTEAVLVLQQPPADATLARSHYNIESSFAAPHPDNTDTTVLHMQLVAANQAPQVEGLEEFPGKVNYFIGNDPTQWHTDIPIYAKVTYRDVYPGVDLVYHGYHQYLEYDFVVAPGVDPNVIRLAFQDHTGHAVPICVDAQGNLILQTSGGELRLHKPLVYQEIAGTRVMLEGGFLPVLPCDALGGEMAQFSASSSAFGPSHTLVGFHTAAYDASKPLVIDPVLSYSTYLGGSKSDEGISIAVDASGHAYVTGTTASVDFPTANPFQKTPGGSTDVFVAKIDPTGSALMYATYLGGSNIEESYAVAVDTTGNTYVTGWTFSTNFPTVNAFQKALVSNNTPCRPHCPDAFVVKINSEGSALVYSTYLGSPGADFAYGVAVDSVGHAYVTGETTRPGYSSGGVFYVETRTFPTMNPWPKGECGDGGAFVTKLHPTGSTLVYSSCLSAMRIRGLSIAVDTSGSAYVTGEVFPLEGIIMEPPNKVMSIMPATPHHLSTVNPLQPAWGGGSDAFIAKVNPTGSALVYATYLGGISDEQGLGIAVDSSGHAYVAGLTGSKNFPTVHPFQPTFGRGIYHAFIVKVGPEGSALVYATYLGGSGDKDVATAITTDAAGHAYVTGWTMSEDFPVASPLQPAFGRGFCSRQAPRGTDLFAKLPQRCGDAFVAKINPEGSALVYSTYLGGRDDDYALSIAIDASNNIYVAGATYATSFPIVNPFQKAFRGVLDAFIVKISDTETPSQPSSK